MEHMKYLKQILDHDHEVLIEKERTYQGSWKKRGGVGAFMMLARKWDRIEIICKNFNYDIFTAINNDLSGKDGSMLAEVRDLRCYLALVEAEIIDQTKSLSATAKPRWITPLITLHHEDGTPKEDSNRHATDAFVSARDSLVKAIKVSGPETA